MNKLYKTLDYWSRDILNFGFLEKSLGMSYPPHFVYDFQERCFSCYILLIGQNIAWLPWLLVEILVNMCIVIICFPGCDVINFEINHILLIKPFLFLYMSKNSRQKFKYLQNE